ncbi:MAG: hypothetical protein LBC13_00355, partial [Clostridiales bacterium]|nr:hypothetical protein [Clostridiales bacterium]
MKNKRESLKMTAAVFTAILLATGFSACGAEKISTLNDSQTRGILTAALNNFKSLETETDYRTDITGSSEYLDGEGNRDDTGNDDYMSFAKTGSGSATVLKAEHRSEGSFSVSYYGKAGDGKYYRASEYSVNNAANDGGNASGSDESGRPPKQPRAPECGKNRRCPDCGKKPEDSDKEQNGASEDKSSRTDDANRHKSGEYNVSSGSNKTQNGASGDKSSRTGDAYRYKAGVGRHGNCADSVSKAVSS